MAIKYVYDTFIGNQLRAPSAHANAFYKACTSGFKDLAANNKGKVLQKEDFVAAGEDLIEPFLKRLSD